MSVVVLVQNPDWPPERIERAKRGEIKPYCHDRTPMADVRCECGHVMHIHLSQIEPIPSDVVVAALCHSCKRPFEFDRDTTVRELKEAWGWA